ncbi:replicative DNA helicase [Lachnospiraceae bacterium JLR.KK009]|jgi:replicative DNA helicase|nr:replicative DNA helicase [Lachnospiraceae bacterium A2]MCI8706771.1 replicative DNA helicase [Lachnospiraceae bacterium]MCI8881751.1 replicative DNA helicase [Lachnospiraceae bacterium]
MEEAVLKRNMPSSKEAEQSVVGSMIMDREAVIMASEILVREDFYYQDCGVLFESMLELYNEEEPIDVVTLQNRLREKDVPEQLKDISFVGEMVTSVPTSANIKHYANIVKEKSMLRRLIRVNEDIANQCYLGRDSLEDILADTEKKIFDLLQNRGHTDFVPIKQIVINALEKIEQASKTKGNVTGIATGFMDLDYRTSGLQPSDLVLVAARPSMGKTAFVLNIAQYVAFHSGLCTAIFSLEMSKEQLVNRLFSLESRVDAQLLRSGSLADSDWEKLIEGAGTIGRSNLIIDDTPGISISELRSKCRKYKLEHDLKLIIIDYLQLMSGSGRSKSDSRQQEISDISRSLKGLARELNVPVVALSQLSRQVEQRPDHRPMLSDLRESGAIEQDADVVMFIYRDDYYNKDTPDKNIAEIIIAKQRNGPIGTINLVWLPQYTKFANMEKR